MTTLSGEIDIKDALKLALDWHDHVPVSDLPRLAARAFEPSGEVEFHFEILKGIDSLVKLSVKAKATIIMQCQRCLQPMPVSIDTNTQLVPIYKEAQAKTLDPAYDPLDLTLGPVTYQDLLEDECLLALPQVPLHDLDTCQAKLPEPVEVPEVKKNPFMVLKGLKDDKTGK